MNSYPNQQPYQPSQQPSFQAAPPQKPPTLWRRFRTRSRRFQWSIGCGTILFALVACGICGAIANALPPSTHTASSSTPTAQTSNNATTVPTQTSSPTQASQPTSTPTQKPTQVAPTPTPTSPPVNGTPLLTSATNVFTSLYGQPDAHTDTSIASYHYQKYGDSNTDFLIVWTDTTDGNAYAHRVQNVNAQADTNGWNITQANTKCSMFYPADAVYKNQVQVTSGPAVVRIYSSASLPKLFPPTSLTAADANTVKARHFDPHFLYPVTTTPPVAY